MKEYYAHINRKTEEKTTVEEHNYRVAKMARSFGNRASEAFGNLAYIEGIGHDVAKETDSFQGVLDGSEHHINHAIGGAAALSALLQTQSPIKDPFCEIATVHNIRGHHCGLLDQYDFTSSPGRTLLETSKFLVKYGVEVDGKTNAVMNAEDATHVYQSLKNSKYIKSLIKDDGTIDCPDMSDASNEAKMLFTRMLLSCLVDADYTCSAIETGDEEQYISDAFIDSDKYLKLFEKYREKILKSREASPLDPLREYLYTCAIQAGQGNPPAIATMNAPTGIGKTLAYIRYALEQCKRNGQDRIFIVMPRLALTEQVKNILVEMFGDNVVIEDDSRADNDEKKRMYAERWNAPIVITTDVKFFETIMHNRPSSLRCLHSVMNAVVIYDEYQMMDASLLDATLNTLQALTKYFHTSILLASATPPAYTYRKGMNISVRNVVQNEDWLYQEYSKVKKMKISCVQTPLTLEGLATLSHDSNQELYIFNTKKKANQMYEYMKRMHGQENVYILTTDMCAQHRIDTLNIVIQQLNDHKPCYLISTQCVEAGVDFSFPRVYREYGPMHALIQSFGRLSRNAEVIGEGFIFSLDSSVSGAGVYPDQKYKTETLITKYIIQSHAWAIDINDRTVIEEYYKEIFDGDGSESHDKEVIQDAINKMKFATVQKEYKVISDQDKSYVIVPYRNAINIYETLCKEIYANNMVITKKQMKEANPVAVSVYNNNAKYLGMCERLCLRTGCETIPSNWYIATTPELYGEKGINVLEGGLYV